MPIRTSCRGLSLCAGLLLLNLLPVARATVTFTATTNWTCPAGLTSVQAQCWGGGGAGGSSLINSASSGGGGGGGYSAGTITVTPGAVYLINVGAGGVANTNNSGSGPGGDTYITNAAASGLLMLAKGGGGGVTALGNGGEGAGGAGGSASAGTGTTKYSGGAGGNSGNTANGGGGGSSAGTGSNGNNGGASSSGSAGAGGAAVAGGGAGGAGSTGSGSGTAGGFPGGGGGGSRSSGSIRAGATGGGGQVILTYTVQPAAYLVQAAGSGSATMTAGSSAGITVTALSSSGAALTGMYQTENLSFYGLASSPSNNAPTITDVNGVAQPITAAAGATNTTLVFVNGVATFGGTTNGLLKAYNGTGVAATLNCSDGIATSASGAGASGLSLTVNAAPSTNLVFITPAQSLSAGSPSGTITVQRQDVFGNPNSTDANLTANLTTTSGTGEFLSTSQTGTITSVAINTGSSSASFLYEDSGLGTPTIKAAGGTLNSASQQETITLSSLTWSGSPATHNWNLTDADWVGGSGVFANGDAVTFNDSGSASSPINLAGALSPVSVTVNATNLNYTFSGSGSLDGSAALAKNGAGTLTIACANSFSGGSTISGGVLDAQNSTALGTGNVTVANGAVLQLDGSLLSLAEPLSLNGSGPSGNGALLNVANSNTYSGAITLAGNARINSAAGTLALSGGSIGGGSVALSLGGSGSGVIGDAIATSGSVAKDGSGTVTLNGTNTYPGGVTISAGNLGVSVENASGGSLGAAPASANPTNVVLNGGTLLGTASVALNANRGIGIGPITGSAGATGMLAAATGQTLSVEGVIASAGNTGTDNLVINPVAGNGGTVLLGGANTFTGSTVVSNGFLQVANPLALQDSTVNYSSPGGYLVFDPGITAATLGGLSGSQTLGLTNLASQAVNLSVGTNGASTTYAGGFADAGLGGGLTKIGSGTLTLTGNGSFTGAAAVSSGILQVNGGALNVGAMSVLENAGAELVISGGSLTTGAAANIGSGSSGLLVSSGTATFNGGLTTDLGGDTANVIAVTGGTLSGSSITLGRTYLINNSTQPTAGSTTLGLYIDGGAVNLSGSLNIGNTSAAVNSSANARMDAGSLTVGGQLYIGLNNTVRWSDMDMNGGTLAVPDTAIGLCVGGAYAGEEVFLMRSGTASVGKITLGQSGDGGGAYNVDMTGGTLYIGAGGIAQAGSGTPTITLARGTLGASANWSSTLALTLGGTTLQAANNLGTAYNITLNGALGGTALTKTGGGTLTLGGADTYTGGTTVSGGTLLVNGSITGAVSVASGAVLGGTGTISGNAAFASGALASFTAGSPLTAGVLALNNNSVTVNVPGGTPLAAGAYTLMNYTASGSTGFFNTAAPTYTGAGVASGTVSSISTGGGAVTLTVTSVNGLQLTWTGDGASNAWDYATLNWLNGSTPVAYGDGELVTFTDAGSMTPAVNVTTTVKPLGVVVSAAGNYTFGGPGRIAGAATLTKTNAGMLTLLETNSYSGVTTIAGGTLRLGNGTTFGSVGTNLIQDSGTLIVDLPGSNTFANVIIGTGGLVQAGTGTLALGANNSYLGGTLISAGTLQVNSGASIGAGNVTNNGALVFNSSGNATISSPIGGSGSLTVQNGGTVALAANNTYSGGTSVRSGTLLVNNPSGSGTGGGAVTVYAGGTLGGGGSVSGPVTINAGGTLAPGNSVGTFAVNNNLTANGAVFDYTLGSASDLTTVSGNLTLSGTLNVTNGSGFKAGTYTLFTYGGTLTLGSLTINMPLYASGAINTSTPGQVNLVVTTLAAFPGALGYGASATGGRNGTVYHVTSLADDGSAGTLRVAVSQPNRIIVFDVGGYINISSAISASDNLTIAGQTAPGGGIGIMGDELSFYNRNNIICRHLRVRQGGTDTGSSGINLGSDQDANGNSQAGNMIFDHTSVEFGQWDSIDAVNTTNFTIQNCIIADPINQQFGAHVEGSDATYVNNLWVNAHNRQPLAKANTIYINNVIYDFQAGYTVADTGGFFSHDIINNYFISGPSTSNAGDNFYQFDTNQTVYFSGNILDNNLNGTLGGGVSTAGAGSYTPLAAPWSPVTAAIPIASALSAYRSDVSEAGAHPIDQLDQLVISQVTSLGTQGRIIGETTDTGLGNSGFGTITNGTPATDTDGDGMPDYWKSAVGLTLTNANDAMIIGNDGYANIEHYINWLAEPHAVTGVNSAAPVDLTQYASGFTNASPTYHVVGVSGGAAVLSGHVALYTPSANFYGLGSFTFSVLANDGSTMTNTVTVCVSPLINAPAPTLAPQFSGITATGSGVVMSGSGGSAGGNFYLLGTTNLWLPASQWTVISTNQFNAGGYFDFTNTSVPRPAQLFYMLRLP